MATVYLTSTAPPDDPSRPYPYDELNRMRESADADVFGVHTVTNTASNADVILFVENCDTFTHYAELRKSPLYCQDRDRCFLFTRNDFPIPFLPGIYPSIPARWYSSQRTRTGPYLISFATDFITPDLSFRDVRHLASFVGKQDTDPVRSRLFDYPDTIYAEDTSSLWPYGELSEAERADMQANYVRVCHQSLFVLCPRGKGASSIRLFESMRMGRAPVILSDEWVPPVGPDWDSFSLRVPENEGPSLPKILQRNAGRAREMGRIARETWENWFSREATFHRSIESCLDIQASRNLPESMLRLSVALQFTDPRYLRIGMRRLLPARVRRLVSSI